MKKTIVWVSVCILLLVFAGCDSAAAGTSGSGASD